MPGGRPPIKRNNIQQLVEDGTLEMLALGADNEQDLIKALNIGRSRWSELKKEIPGLSDILSRTLYTKFTMVKGANLKKALGYDYEETEDTIVVDKNGREHPVTKITKRHCPPDVQAQKIAMANIVRNARKAQNGAMEIDWTNSVETVEVKAEGSVSLVLDEAIKNVLKELEEDK